MPISRLHHALNGISRLVGAAEPGDKLPPELELAGILGVSRVTVRLALDQLWHEGAIVRRWGAGTFVAQPAASHQRALHNNFYVESSGVGSLPERIARAGHMVELHDFAVTANDIPSWVKSEGGFSVPLWRVRRCIVIDGVPGALMYDHFPQEIGGTHTDPYRLQNLSLDFQSFLASYGHRVVKQEARLTAVAAKAKDADSLGLEHGAAVICAEQRSIAESGDIVACSDLLYNDGALGQILVRTASD